MRIYEGSPRQDYEEVLRSVGAFLDQRGIREILLAEAPDGFILQGLVPVDAADTAWTDPTMSLRKETFTFLDDDISRFIEEAVARRRRGAPVPDLIMARFYERSMRVLGRYIDQQKPRDVFFFEQEGAFVVRLLMPTRAGVRHVLVEFTRDEIETMIERAPAWRAGAKHVPPPPSAS